MIDFHTACRESGLPLGERKRTVEGLPRAFFSRCRGRRPSASSAGSPSGTRRRFWPFPRGATSPFRRSTSPRRSPDDFTDPEPCRVHHVEHRPIPEPAERLALGSVEEAQNLLDARAPWGAAGRSGVARSAHRDRPGAAARGRETSRTREPPRGGAQPNGRQAPFLQAEIK